MSMNSLNNYMDTTLRFYEDHVDEYVRNTSKMEDTEWLEKFSSRLPAGGRILDVGCAAGRDCAWFAKKGFNCFGIDLSPSMVDRARLAVPGVNFSVMNILDLDFPDGSFDGIWCSCVLIHISKADVPRALGEMHRVLAPKGSIFFWLRRALGKGLKRTRAMGTQKNSAPILLSQN